MSARLTFGTVQIEATHDRVSISFPLAWLEQQAAAPANAASRRLVAMLREVYDSAGPNYRARSPADLAEISSLLAEAARA